MIKYTHRGRGTEQIFQLTTNKNKKKKKRTAPQKASTNLERKGIKLGAGKRNARRETRSKYNNSVFGKLDEAIKGWDALQMIQLRNVHNLNVFF